MTTGSVAKVSVVHHTSTAIINQQAALLKNEIVISIKEIGYVQSNFVILTIFGDKYW